LTTGTLLVVAGAALSGISSALLVSALVPVIEWAFGYTTDIKLLELGSLNQPVLKRLILEAPGTYHHSFLVGNLVESAAESIGANPLLSRVAALYHDLGKLKNPLYFAENQRRGENRHDKLQPTMSALIIKAHVKDSVRIAEENGLGSELRDIIEQHHGTTLIQFFYRKALEQHEGSGAPPGESDFRYPGPKPQTREAGLVLLADSVEAAVRSLPEKTPSRIQGMVHTIILDKFQDGQLDECDLTLRDLNQIERIFVTVLQGVHHARPEYPSRPKTSTRPRLVAVAGDADV
jgi:putative nucleotidyltransferase with HDIG domain